MAKAKNSAEKDKQQLFSIVASQPKTSFALFQIAQQRLIATLSQISANKSTTQWRTLL